jgi:hypothetical protein
MYLRWLKERVKPQPRMNVEMLEVFRYPTVDQATELDALLPAILDRVFNVRP